MSYIIERPAGMPDWVEIGVRVMCKEYESESNWCSCILYGYNPNKEAPYITNHGSYPIAKPFIPWAPKEGEWCAFWDKDFNFHNVSIYKGIGSLGGYKAFWHTLSDHVAWDYCARITNDDGSLIDIRCTVDELKAKTDWLGPEEE
jgi:hypothetical protein